MVRNSQKNSAAINFTKLSTIHLVSASIERTSRYLQQQISVPSSPNRGKENTIRHSDCLRIKFPGIGAGGHSVNPGTCDERSHTEQTDPIDSRYGRARLHSLRLFSSQRHASRLSFREQSSYHRIFQGCRPDRTRAGYKHAFFRTLTG